ncbi:MAG: M50 family metallopeptidase [Elusimicrobiota bacterium]
MIRITTLLALPMIAAVALSYAGLINIFISNINRSFPLAVGFIIYLLAHFSMKRKKIISYLYVLSHEFSHAIFGFLSGNRIKKISVKPNKGYVIFSAKSNVITAISPYIFPLYNAIFFLFYIFVNKGIEGKYFGIFLFFQGFLISFHILNTIEVISLNQKDFKETGGRISSIVLITLFNLIIFATIILLSTPSGVSGLKIFFTESFKYYVILIKKIFLLFKSLIFIVKDFTK